MEIVAIVVMTMMLVVGLFLGFWYVGTIAFTRGVVGIWILYGIFPTVILGCMQLYSVCIFHLLYALFMLCGHIARQVCLHPPSYEHC